MLQHLSHHDRTESSKIILLEAQRFFGSGSQNEGTQCPDVCCCTLVLQVSLSCSIVSSSGFDSCLAVRALTPPLRLDNNWLLALGASPFHCLVTFHRCCCPLFPMVVRPCVCLCFAPTGSACTAGWRARIIAAPAPVTGR